MRALLCLACLGTLSCDEPSTQQVDAPRPAQVAASDDPLPANRVASVRGLPKGGMFAREAVSVWEEVAGSREPFTLRSPDGRSRVDARWLEASHEGGDQAVVVEVAGAIGAHRIRLVPGVGTEVLWSPRSDALAISTSGAGLNGIYRLILLRRIQGRIEERDVTGLVSARFGQPVRCDWAEPPNVAAVAWLPSGNLIASAEIVNHSVCDSYGAFKAYEIDPAAMRIVREFSQSEAKRMFGPQLGWELAHADDACEGHPERCTVAYRRSAMARPTER